METGKISMSAVFVCTPSCSASQCICSREVCSANATAKALKPGNLKAKKIQTVFVGNTTSLRMHIARFGEDHYTMYEEGCLRNKVTMDPRAIPESIAQAAQSAKDPLGQKR